MTEPLHFKISHSYYLGTTGAGNMSARLQDLISQLRETVPRSQRECMCVLADCKFNWPTCEFELFLWLEDC